MAYAMLGILVITYVFIKVKAPKLPQHHKGHNFMKGVVVIAFSWIVSFIAYGSFMKNFRHTKMEELLISHIIANTCWNVLVPWYFIYNTPNLCQYVKSYFSFLRSNQVEPILPH